MLFLNKLLMLVLISTPILGWSQNKKTNNNDKADQIITNRRLRAESGSLSKWSGSIFFNYQGGSLGDPLKPERPNIVEGADALTLQNFFGEVGIRYRTSTQDSITASTGLFITTPFHGAIDRDEEPQLKDNFDRNHQELNIQDPFLKYTHIDKFFDIQSLSNIKPILITNAQQEKLGYYANLVLSQTFMKDIDATGLSVGFTAQWFKYFHDKTIDKTRNLAENVFGIAPSAEYVINDTLNFRTLFGWQVYEQTRGMAHHTYVKRKVYQSIGLGISVTRDIFIYPNLQYIPSDIRSDRTNIAISANINLF